MTNVTSRTKSRSRTKEFISLLEKSTLGVIQPKTKWDLYHAAINIGGNFEFSRLELLVFYVKFRTFFLC